MTEVLLLGRRSVREILRYPEATIPVLFIPLFFLAVNIGQVSPTFPSSTPFLQGQGYVAFQLPVSLMFAVATATSGLALVTEIDSGYFDKLLVAPIRRTSLILGRLTADLVRGIAGSAIVLLVGIVIFGAHVQSGPAGAVPASMDPADAIYVVSPGRSVVEQDADSLHCSGRGVHWWRDVLHLQPVPDVNQDEGGTSGERDHVLLPGQETATMEKHNNRQWHHNLPIRVCAACIRPGQETPDPCTRVPVAGFCGASRHGEAGEVEQETGNEAQYSQSECHPHASTAIH